MNEKQRVVTVTYSESFEQWDWSSKEDLHKYIYEQLVAWELNYWMEIDIDLQ